jgi:hypothetical protein
MIDSYSTAHDDDKVKNTATSAATAQLLLVERSHFHRLDRLAPVSFPVPVPGNSLGQAFHSTAIQPSLRPTQTSKAHQHQTHSSRKPCEACCCRRSLSTQPPSTAMLSQAQGGEAVCAMAGK